MISRALTSKRKSPRSQGDNNRSLSAGSILEYDEYGLVGFADDLPLVFCGDNNKSRLSLREVLRASVAVMGQSRLGMTAKVVLLEGKVYAVKRFRKVGVGKSDFNKRVEMLAQVSKKCQYLVPITAYLYAKRIKFVLCDYFPMGSLADLLAGGREYGHTVLDWNQRLTIALSIARAIAFIHMQCPPNEKNVKMNAHGNIKPSNVMITVNFAACLSDYGFTQLAELEEVSDTCQRKPPPVQQTSRCDINLCQECDIYNFGLVLLDMLGGDKAPSSIKCLVQRKEQIREGSIEFFEFLVEGRERKQALQVLDVAIQCTNEFPGDRPPIEQVLRYLEDVKKLQ